MGWCRSCAGLRSRLPATLRKAREGQGTRNSYDFLHQARGSLCEIETQLTFADRLGLLSSENASRLSEAAGEIARMLNGLINALKRSMAP
ncbi:MAG TPA: four helix bundle protein [Terriglobales bacterium]|nr:four helix bundle protein [Terriglobales bacterium]